MNTTQKSEVIDFLKGKFEQYNNFYITDTESLSVAQINKLRRVCFDKKVELKVAKNTLIKKALESTENEDYNGVFNSLKGVTALMFSESAKEPAIIISDFRKEYKTEKPMLKAAYIEGALFEGADQLAVLKEIKGKTELIGEIIGLLQSPAKNVMSALNAGNKLAGIVKALEERAAS